jgi:hypothetical protein
MTEGVVKADHRSRRMVLVLVVAAVVVCGILFFWLRPWAVRFLMAMEPDQALRTIKWVLVILFLGGTPGAAYLMSLGRRILSENRFPPMGMKVLKDTPVLTGRAARIRGGTILALALVMFCLCLGGATYAWLALPRVWQY